MALRLPDEKPDEDDRGEKYGDDAGAPTTRVATESAPPPNHTGGRWEGTEFAGYRIVREIGRGGMGVVFLAEEHGLNRLVALKVVAPELSDDEIFRRRFEREAQHAASIDHPNVVPIFAFGSHGGQLYLAMRYVDGSDLARLLKRRGPLSVEETARIIEQTGAALDTAHAQGLIHRDVKPANILLTGGGSDGHVYLTDFGLTKQGSSDSSFTYTGGWVGTVDYAAPEQIKGGVLSARTDVYGLGCVLFQTLTGHLPYGGTDAQKMWAHMHSPPPSLQELGPDVAAVFDPIVLRSLSKDPVDRYPSAGDLGRTVKAASVGSVNTVTERSLATGVAATGIPAGDEATAGEGFHEHQKTRELPSGGARGATEATPEPLTADQIELQRRYALSDYDVRRVRGSDWDAMSRDAERLSKLQSAPDQSVTVRNMVATAPRTPQAVHSS